jgi:hypothetical protein
MHNTLSLSLFISLSMVRVNAQRSIEGIVHLLSQVVQDLIIRLELSHRRRGQVLLHGGFKHCEGHALTHVTNAVHTGKDLYIKYIYIAKILYIDTYMYM